MTDEVPAWTIRRQHPDELAAVMQTDDLAFGPDERIGELVAALQADDSFTGDSFIAVTTAGPAKDAVIGPVMLTRSWLDTEDRLLTLPILSPLAVHPDHQGRGVGEALIAYAIGSAREAGEIGVVLEGDPRYYRRFGVEPAEPWGLLRPSPRIPSAAFQWVRLPAHEPWMRGRVVYPDVFWRMDAVGLRGRRGPGSGLAVTTVTLGARDVPRLARFYAELLGRPVPEVPEGEDWGAIRDDDGAITVAIQHEPDQVPAAWPARPGDQHMQMHLEIRADRLDEAVAHAVSCGASEADVQPQKAVRVMLDPENHPFCLWVATS